MAEQVKETATGQKINWVFTNLQNLQIQPTEHNVQILVAAQKFLREVYGETQMLEIENQNLQKKITEMEKAVSDCECADAEPQDVSEEDSIANE